MGSPRPAEALSRFLAPEAEVGRVVRLSSGEAHHLREVRRLRRGARVLLLDGRGREFLGRVEEVSRQGVEVRVLSRERVEPPPRPEIWVAVPLLKRDHLSFLVEKAAELGVNRLLLVRTARTVPRGGEGAVERLRRRALQALKQCGRLWPPAVEGPLALRDLLALEADRRLFAYEGETRPLCGAHLALPPEGRLLLLSGPEGGLAPEEATALSRAGFTGVSLGRAVLRAETAAFYLMALAHFHLRLGGAG